MQAAANGSRLGGRCASGANRRSTRGTLERSSETRRIGWRRWSASSITGKAPTRSHISFASAWILNNKRLTNWPSFLEGQNNILPTPQWPAPMLMDSGVLNNLNDVHCCKMYCQASVGARTRVRANTAGMAAARTPKALKGSSEKTG